MKNQTIELWVGVLVIIGIAALAFLSFQVAGGSQYLSAEGGGYRLTAEFDDVGGLKAKAPVKSAGVVVGRVLSVRLNPQTYRARVEIEVSKQYPFSVDASARILTSGILGEQYIGLEEGAEMDVLADGDTISQTSSAIVLENLIGKLMTSFMENKAKE